MRKLLWRWFMCPQGKHWVGDKFRFDNSGGPHWLVTCRACSFVYPQ